MGSRETVAAARYSAAEFEKAVMDAQPKIAVFDCDGTLWSGDAGYGFMVWSMEAGLVSRNASDWIDSQYRLYRAGQVSEAEMCGQMVQIYDGLREEEMRRAAAEYFRSHIETNIFPEMQRLLDRLTSKGTQIWAVSSTNNWVIDEGVSRFGIPPSRVLCARSRVENGIATSELIDVPTDEAKAAALVRAGVPHPDAVFGNSIHDAAMLEIAKHSFPVNPTPALETLAATRGWTVFYPDSVLRDAKQ